MRTISRRTKIAFFITLGVCIAVAATVLSTSWIILNWREIVPLILGVIFFGFIIAGVILNTIFLVREIRRNEQQDSFLNAVTHELKTPITSIRLYLETLQKRNVDDEQRREFYQVMLDDTQRLMGTVEGVLRAARVSAEERAAVAYPGAGRAAGAGCDRSGAFASSSFDRGAGLGAAMASPASN